jgi:hypothetical protein
VDGVLFGQEPKGESTIRYVDLRWEVEGSMVRLIVVDASGAQIRSRPMRKGLVARALAFAADGRPLAVTMVTARPLSELKILAHPTLVDTAIGLRLIEIDRFVDTYARKDDQVREAELLVSAHEALYEHAREARLLAIEPETLSDASGVPKDLIEKIQAEVRERTKTDFRTRLLLTSALKDPASIRDKERSPLAAKPEYFDADLVAMIAAAAKPGISPEEFAAAIARAAKDGSDALALQSRTAISGLSAKLRMEGVTDNKDPRIDQLIKFSLEGKAYRKALNKAKGWLYPAPEFERWSGVREREFGVSTDEVFPTEAQTASPIDFMLQVAFTSPAYFRADEDKEGESSTETSSFDEHPWEFPSIRPRIQEKVLESLKGDARAQAILTDSSDFVMLQRFFRLALAGKLGTEFPVEKFEGLMRAASSPTPAVRTPRWNVRPLQQEVQFAATLDARLTQAILKFDPSFKAEKESDGSGTKILRPMARDLKSHAATLSTLLRKKLGAVTAFLVASQIRAVCDLMAENLEKMAEHSEAEEALLKRRKPGDAGWSRDWEAHWAAFLEWHSAWSRRWNSATSALLATLPAPTPPKSGESEPAPANPMSDLQPVSRIVALLAPPMEIRRALGVIRDEKVSAEGRDVPLPPLD